jgi:hypothetical protein
MSLRALAPFPLLCGIIVLFGACGDRFGEPIVAAAPELESPGGSGGASGGLPAAGGTEGQQGGGAGGSTAEAGAGGSPSDRFGGLCTSCTRNDDCGDISDHCLEGEGGELFCARDCDEWYGCPVGYECVSLGSVAEPQCVPQTHTCIHLEFKPPPPPAAAIQAEAIEFLNDLRAERGLYPLVPDVCLAMLAEQSAIELALSGDYFSKFERECSGENSCECGWRGQFESGMATYDLRYDDIFERPILGALEESPDDFQGTLFSDNFSRVGYGMVLTGDEGFAAYSFGL